MKHFVSILTLILLCLGTGMNMITLDKGEVLTNKAVSKFATKMKKKGYRACGSGGSNEENKAKVIRIAFNVDHVMSIDEARKILHEMTDELLNDINSNEKLRPYLADVPFKVENLSLSLFTSSTEPEKVGDIVIVSMHRGILRYKAKAETLSGFEEVLEESF